MAKQTADTYTLDLLDKPKRGRPRKPDAKTPAQRAREYRARKRFAVKAEPAFMWVEGKQPGMWRRVPLDSRPT